VIAQIKRKLVRRAYKPKTTIVKTKWEKCDLNTYQSTITDGVAPFLKSLFATISCDFRDFSLLFGFPAFLHWLYLILAFFVIQRPSSRN
jgi:hypothetical protein